MTPTPRDDCDLNELSPSEEYEEAQVATDEPGVDPVAPEHPPGLATDPEVAEPETDNEEIKTLFDAFLATLPPSDVAILRLCESQLGKFGWLVGRSAEGAPLPLRLERRSRNDWVEAFQALPGGSPSWSDAGALTRYWKQRGPQLYQLIHVDLPNLHDGARLVLADFREGFHAGTVPALSMAIVELLCRNPHVYWWLVFDGGNAGWNGLLDTLKKKYQSLVDSLSVHALEQQWRQEGRPRVLKVLG